MAQLIWTEPALQDLEQIASFIALDKPKAAQKLVRRVFSKVEILENFPLLGSRPHDLPHSRYRHLVVSPLRIFYRVEADSIFIIYVMRSEKLLTMQDLRDHDH